MGKVKLSFIIKKSGLFKYFSSDYAGISIALNKKDFI